MSNNVTISDRQSVIKLFNDILDRLDVLESRKRGHKKRVLPSDINEVISFFHECGYSEEKARKFFDSYSANNWCDGKNNPVCNWKQKAINVWFKPEEKNVVNEKSKPNITHKKEFYLYQRTAEEQAALLEELRKEPDSYIAPEEYKKIGSGLLTK